MPPEQFPRTTYLLGAGASVEAGLPTSTGLTREITGRVDEAAWHGNAAQALHVAIGAMVAHDTGRGSKAFEGIDVERLFSAIRMLADRDELEIAPFVANWNQNLEYLGTAGRLPAFWGKNLKKELAESRFGDSGLERLFKEGVAALAGNNDLGPTFKALQSHMIAALGSALAVDAAAVDYLAPVVTPQGAPIQIATLNYDRSVELLANRAGVAVDTGIEQWQGGYDWSWAPNVDVHLLKLHGSLDWFYERDPDARLDRDRIRLAKNMTPEELTRYGDSLALVFGQGAKLRSDGPFLAMLVELDNFLDRTQRLVIVGYSFRDDHINAAIRRWMNKTKTPMISVINPSIEEWKDFRRAPEFYRALHAAMRDKPPAPELREGNELLSLSASMGLVQVVGPGPRLDAAPINQPTGSAAEATP